MSDISTTRRNQLTIIAEIGRLVPGCRERSSLPRLSAPQRHSNDADSEVSVDHDAGPWRERCYPPTWPRPRQRPSGANAKSVRGVCRHRACLLRLSHLCNEGPGCEFGCELTSNRASVAPSSDLVLNVSAGSRLGRGWPVAS